MCSIPITRFKRDLRSILRRSNNDSICYAVTKCGNIEFYYFSEKYKEEHNLHITIQDNTNGKI